MQNHQQNQLLQRVDELSMVTTDLALYLDTHPCDEAAKNAFFQYRDMQREAVTEYQKCYGPLTTMHATQEEKWTWAVTPFPWQKECD